MFWLFVWKFARWNNDKCHPLSQVGGTCDLRVLNTTPLPAKIYANEVAQFIFLKEMKNPKSHMRRQVYETKR